MRADRPASPLIPGFDFLKNLASQAGKGLEGLNQLNNLGQGLGAGLGQGLAGGLGGFKQWVAPTLDPEELDKRIEELRTVQFWLEQNARLLGATIQALEVQKMTLSTLRSMNMKMPDLQQVFGAMAPPTGEPSPANRPGKSATEAPKAEPSKPPASKGGARKSSSRAASSGAQAAEPPAGLVDPMKWWGALTEQFQQLAAQALASAPGAAAGTGGEASASMKSRGSTSARAQADRAADPASASVSKSSAADGTYRRATSAPSARSRRSGAAGTSAPQPRRRKT